MLRGENIASARTPRRDRRAASVEFAGRRAIANSRRDFGR
jgi:hypothetical protein